VFHNRKHELDDILRVVSSPRSEMLIVYGRRGAGKSALVTEALRDQHHLFYQATTRTLPQQLEDLTAALQAYAPEAVLPGVLPSFDAFLGALSRLARARREAPAVIVIDELPYLAQADPSVPSVVQRWWDEIRKEGLTNVKLFLLGSMVSWMEEHTLSEQGPLHNRRTGQVRLDPLGYAEAALFYPSYSPVDRISAYAIWGGLPSYIAEIDPTVGLWENVLDVTLRPASRLSDEPSWLRFTDLRSDMVYSSMLRAIAMGNRRPSKIALAVGRTRADEVMHQLERLCELRLVERVVPIHEDRDRRARNSLYRLTDHFVAFWYRYVDRMRHLLGVRRYSDALVRIRADFDKYVSEYAFEDICRQYLWRALAHELLPPELSFDTVGSWWVAREDAMDEIDAVATSDGRAVLIGECKWSVQRADLRDLQGLSSALWKAAPDLRPADRPWRVIFSRSGFDADLAAIAARPEERVLLVGPDQLY
jgi:uncharacterized protein